jgi:hypothetical protein
LAGVTEWPPVYGALKLGLEVVRIAAAPGGAGQ